MIVSCGSGAELIRTCAPAASSRRRCARCASSVTAFVPFFPLGGGLDPIDTTRLEKSAARHGATVQQVALAALLAASPVMLPIPGTGSLAHLAENVGAASVQLTPEDIASLAG